MKILVETTRELTSDDELDAWAKIDSDNTVKLTLPDGNDSTVETGWLTRSNLFAIRALINKTLQYVE